MAVDGVPNGLRRDLRERAGRPAAQAALMGAFRELTTAGVTTRDAAGRVSPPVGLVAVRVAPASQLTPREQANVLAVLNGVEFVDRTPVQVCTVLLARGEGVHNLPDLGRERAGEGPPPAGHPARTRPELIATGPGRCSPGTSRSCPAQPRASTTTPTS